MADTFEFKSDVKSALSGLDRLAGDMATHLARSMCVAGGKVIRDEAKLLAPVGTEEGGSIHPGALRDSIYLAFKDGSDGKNVRYSVSWNAKKAPHGHLLEFGHWQPYVVAKIAGGGYYSTKIKKDAPTWTPAHPFLRPALDSAGARATQAMIARGRERLPELLAGGANGDDAVE